MDPREDILASYKESLLQDANEAETRLKVIDRVLFEVLGWTRDDVKVEERVSEDGKTTFADYVIRTGMAAFVVEAKKAGRAQYDIPSTRRIEFDRRIMESETGAAIRQARDYARKLGVQFAVVTNGGQWIVFPAIRIDQVQFEQSSAIIFPNLASILDYDFGEFMSLLSRPSVIQGSLENELLGRIENQLEQRRLNAFYTIPFSRLRRGNLYHLIEDAIATAFSEEIVHSDPELLEKLYVRTPERIRFDSRIQMHIARRQLPLARPAKRPMKGREAEAISKMVTTMVTTAAAGAKPAAVLVLGTVGAGKTTFLAYTRKIAAFDRFLPRSDAPYPHWIYVDFRNFAPNESPVEFIFSALKTYIQNDDFLSDYNRCLRPAYQSEISSMLRGPLKPISNNQDEINKNISNLLTRDFEKGVPYVEKIIAYASQHTPIFLVIDNVDQLEIETLQPVIFSDAIAIAHRLGLSLILSLRDATYVSQRSLPMFDAFDFDPVYIDPPNVGAVLSRRFFVAKHLLSGKQSKFTAENGAEVSLSDTSVIIDVVQASVLGTQVGDLIDVMATSDIRLALRITREFLQYGYTATGRALRTYHETGRYTLPQHEALRAILLGNQSVYSDKYSVVGNPFDAKLSRTEAQLLRLFVTTALVNMSSNAIFQYCRGTDIREALGTIGFGEDVTLAVLGDLCRFRFIHTLTHSKATLEANYVPTRFGGYIVRQLIADPMFIENIMMDTFIADGTIWQELRDFTDQINAERDEVARLRIRMARSTKFFKYVKLQYDPLRSEAMRRGLSSEWGSHPLEALEGTFDANLRRALYSAERNYPESSELAASARRDVVGQVKWFDALRGFGFVVFPDGGPDAFLSHVALERSGIQSLNNGSIITCDVIDAERGPQITVIKHVQAPETPLSSGPSTTALAGIVKFYDARKGFGFIVPDNGGPDIFVQAGALSSAGLDQLHPGQRVQVEVSLGRSGPRAEFIRTVAEDSSG